MQRSVAPEPIRLQPITVGLLALFTLNLYSCYFAWRQGQYSNHPKGESRAAWLALTGGTLYGIGLVGSMVWLIVAQALELNVAESWLGIWVLLAIWSIGGLIAWGSMLHFWRWVCATEVQVAGVSCRTSHRVVIVTACVPVLNLVVWPLAVAIAQTHLHRILDATERYRVKPGT